VPKDVDNDYDDLDDEKNRRISLFLSFAVELF